MALASVAVAFMAASAWAQAPVPLGRDVDRTIPDAPYRSWSLFLVCNAEWLRPQRADDVRDLHARWQAFGRGTGDDHAAVWFFVSRAEPRAEEVDIERSLRYCRRFGLRPSEGPHIVVTTRHPDRWRPGDPADAATPGDPIVIVALGGKSPREIGRVLDLIQDQVVATGLSQSQVDSVVYWEGWVRVLGGACRYLDKVKFTVDAKALRVERTGLCG